MAPHYEAVIAGAGCAGLAIAVELDQSLARDAKILVVDPDLDTVPNKTWSYWGCVDGPHLGAITKTWSEMEVFFPTWSKRQAISQKPYSTVDAALYHQQLLSKLRASPRVTLVQERVLQLKNTARGVTLSTEKNCYSGRWAFQSYDRGESAQVHYPLRQHFGGWVVRTEKSNFDPSSVTLMDFRTPQFDQLRFFYLLPFDTNHALIEATFFSEKVVEHEQYDRLLAEYLQQRIRGSYKIERREYGVIPMEERFYEQRTGKSIFNIGAAGGMTKATTGSTFSRTMRQVRQLSSSLVKYGEPQPLADSELRHQVADLLLLDVLRQKGGEGFEVFEELFSKNSFEAVLSFLDEKTTLNQELSLLRGLKWAPFLRAIWSTAHLWSSRSRRAA